MVNSLPTATRLVSEGCSRLRSPWLLALSCITAWERDRPLPSHPVHTTPQACFTEGAAPRDQKQAGSSTRVYDSFLNVDSTHVFLATSGERGG